MRKVQFSTIIASLLFPVISQATAFTDVPANVWYEDDLQLATSKNWVQGYKDKEGIPKNIFGPADLVTLGQALKVTQMVSGEITDDSNCKNCHWAEGYKLKAMNDYYSVEMNNLDRFINREEMAMLISNAFQLEVYLDLKKHECSPALSATIWYSSPFEDIEHDDPLCVLMFELWKNNVIQGDDSPNTMRSFRPKDPISRAEFVRVAAKSWLAFSEKSFTKRVIGPTIDNEGIQGEFEYTLYHEGEFTIQNNIDTVGVFKMTAPAMDSQRKVVEFTLRPNQLFSIIFDKGVSVGVHDFTISFDKSSLPKDLNTLEGKLIVLENPIPQK